MFVLLRVLLSFYHASEVRARVDTPDALRSNGGNPIAPIAGLTDAWQLPLMGMQQKKKHSFRSFGQVE